MSTVAPTSDADLMDLLRSAGALSVTELANAIDVTPTAIRQRLTRLMAQGLIEREAVRAGRGRPKHRYQLTPKGLRWSGTNFTDLALALWREIGAIPDLNARRTLLQRVAQSLASGYAREIHGKTTAERMRSLIALLSERRVPFSVAPSPETNPIPMLVAHACPYPELAEQDRQICDLERTLFSELLGRPMELTQCRLDGGPSCQFQPT